VPDRVEADFRREGASMKNATGGSSLQEPSSVFFFVPRGRLRTKRDIMDAKKCRICGAEIPPERLEVIPDTLVCVKCSKKIGGEFELQVKVGGTHKAGSLKITGQEVSVKRQRRKLV